ncbi:hypothetical protein E8E11_006048 [Didymella keratinophila]|nr:hypothetical protein E8E11_006048 [Didymella keratinophila]
MLPTLAEVASEVTAYQRTPQWVLPKPDTYFNRVERLLLKLPRAHEAYRKALSHGADMLLSPISRCSAWRYIVKCYAKHNLTSQVSDKELMNKLMPDYPIGSKHIILDNDFYATLQRDNIKLITEPIQSIGGKNIRIKPKDGLQKESMLETDVIIFAIGFRASESFLPMPVRGRDGHCVQRDWEAGPEAFLGLAMYGYPNLFIIAGPNSFNPAGSNPDMKELQIAYIMRCLRWKKKHRATTIEIAQGAMQRYQDWLAKKMGRTVWEGPVGSWYKHKSGRVISPWPTSRGDFKKKLQNHPRQPFVLRDY